MNVLVLEAGGGCGISTIQIIKESLPNFKVIATDCDKFARGLFLADKKFILPKTIENNYSTSIVKLCKKEKIDYIMPTFENGLNKMQDLELPFFTDFKSAILCKDKLNFAKIAKENSINVPKTELLENTKMSFPFFVKPRFGSGGRNIGIVRNEKDKGFFLNRNIEFIAQELLSGEPWNIDVLVKNGFFLLAIPRRDLLIKAEESLTVQIVQHKKLINIAKKIQNILQIKSCFNIQGFLLNNNFFIYEINVRFAAGIIFGFKAGVNFPKHLLYNINEPISFEGGIYSKIPEVKKIK